MANISAFQAKQYLDWCLGGASPSGPSNRWVGLAAGTPTSVSGSELSTTVGYSRLTGLFGAAASPAGSASNTASMVFGSFSSAASILGIHIWDGSPVGSSDMMWYGTLQTARTVAPGDSLVIAAGALIVTLT